MSECPVCLELFTPPIKSCNNGHSVCGVCERSVRTCPECRGVLVYRNISLEKMMDKIQQKCSHEGCHEKFLSEEDLEEHEEECCYKQFTLCFSDTCRSKNKILPLYGLTEHIETQHFNNINNIRLNTWFKQTWRVVNSEFNNLVILGLPGPKYFLFRCSLSETLDFDVCVIENDDADQYTYTVSIDQGLGGDRFTYRNFCMPFYMIPGKHTLPENHFKMDSETFFLNDLTDIVNVSVFVKINQFK